MKENLKKLVLLFVIGLCCLNNLFAKFLTDSEWENDYVLLSEQLKFSDGSVHELYLAKNCILSGNITYDEASGEQIYKKSNGKYWISLGELDNAIEGRQGGKFNTITITATPSAWRSSSPLAIPITSILRSIRCHGRGFRLRQARRRCFRSGA